MADFKADYGAMDAFAATNHAAGEQWTTAASADIAAHFAALAAAIGPIGAPHILPAAAEALPNCFGAASKLGELHHAIADGTTSAQATFHAADNA
ncbi:hypothetical protein ACQI5H_24295 [Mycobacterium heidelbergense]|uniref:hypothetical protein n=1 Tax=Mycobacterium heidelbergense TaxID=53376 RepID=UPI003CEDF9B4